MRNRSEPGQAAQAGFGLERIAVTQRVNGCYCAPARYGWLRRPETGVRRTKDAERRDKASVRTGKNSRQARLVNFQDAGDAKNGTAGL